MARARVVTVGRDVARWREAARGLIVEGVRPEEVIWEEEGAQPMLVGLGERDDTAGRAGHGTSEGVGARVSVPREFVNLAEGVACHRDEGRWGLLYRVLWRIVHGERELLSISVDEDVHRLMGMERQVRFERHKMTAFVRFREVNTDQGVRYVAWYRPGHRVLRLTAPFFANRFATMRWSILTPDECAHWDGEAVTFTPGVEAEPRRADEVEELWRTYYANIFNPARVRVRAMTKEMPVRFWGGLPEAELIPELLRDAPKRVRLMVERQAGECVGAGRYLPEERTIEALRAAARGCRGCELCGPATRTVFGEGPTESRGMMIGEQPGDEEDRAGRPFVGPAGRLLEAVMGELGMDRGALYVTNAVKHFKFEVRGKRRVHSKPSAREVAACVPWLEAEIGAVRPGAILCLGVTPAQALLGREFRMASGRGVVFERTRWAPWVMATWHPSALLRIPDAAAREVARGQFVEDLKAFGERVRRSSDEG